jgi:hypothetical protein
MIGSCCCGGVSSSTTRKRNDSALLATRRTDSRNHFVIAGRARSVRVGVFKIMIAANEQARELRSHGGVQINRILARLDVPKLASDLNRVRNSNDLSQTIIIRPKLWSSVRRSATNEEPTRTGGSSSPQPKRPAVRGEHTYRPRVPFFAKTSSPTGQTSRRTEADCISQVGTSPTHVC